MAKKTKVEAVVAAPSDPLAALYMGIAAKYPGVIHAPGMPSSAKFEEAAFQIPTGSIGLDMMVGPLVRLAEPKTLPSGLVLPKGYWQCGIPAGRIAEFYGWESSGKTSQALLTVAGCQRLGLRAAYVDMEHALDPKWAVRLGVRIEDMPVFQPDSGDQALDIANTLITSGQFNLVVVDSVAALIPASELAADMEIGDATTGGLARLMSTALRKISTHMSGSGCVLLFINQNRALVKFGQPSRITQPGGNALRFYASTRLEISQSDAITMGEGTAVNRVGHMVEFMLKKSKVSVPLQTARSPFYFDRGVDPYIDLVSQAIAVGAVEKSGAWYQFEGVNSQGMVNLVERARSSQDPGFLYRMYNRTMEMFSGMRGYAPEGEVLPAMRRDEGREAGIFMPPADRPVKL